MFRDEMVASIYIGKLGKKPILCQVVCFGAPLPSTGAMFQSWYLQKNEKKLLVSVFDFQDSDIYNNSLLSRKWVKNGVTFNSKCTG